jgi:hypothetical protein
MKYFFHSQENQYTAKADKLFDDKAIKTSKGKFKIFCNSFQPKRIPVPVSRCLPAPWLEYITQSPWNSYPGSLEWKLCQSPGVSGREDGAGRKRKCFFNLEPAVSADIVSHVFGDNSTCQW